MPAVESPRQPASNPETWFASGHGRRLAERVLQECTPELTRVFGNSGLFLRPTADITGVLPGNMLAQVLSLYRVGDWLDGTVRCRDPELPLASGSQSLVLALFVLESSEDASILVREIARVLKPEGTTLLVTLNPWSPTRLRWLGRAGRPLGGSAVEAQLREAGLDVLRRRMLGPVWLRSAAMLRLDPARPGWLDPFRAARVVVAHRRDSAMTPLRKPAAIAGLKPGMSTGTALA